MKKTILFLAMVAISSAALAGKCIKDGDKVSLVGVVSTKPTEMADGSYRHIDVLALNKPICVLEEDAESGALRKSMTSEIQIIGKGAHFGDNVELTGTISTDNVSQYYAVPTAIKVASGKKLMPTKSRIAKIEPNAALYSSGPKDIELIDALVTNVRAAGFMCESVSAAMPLVVHLGYRLSCNGSRYTYDIRDIGGHWVVQVED